MLGEYYNRCRINNGPVGVLGCALFELLLKQLETVTQKAQNDTSYMLDEEFAKLILTQVTLNGLLAQPTHKAEIDALLFAIRKCLIEVPQLTSNIKALFLMTLDLYYSKFSNIGKELESMYAKFLTDECSAADKNTDQRQSSTSSTTEVNSFKKLRSELGGLGGGRNKPEVRINNEYIGRPLKASQRLIYAQQQAAAQKNKDETEEILQEKLFEKEMQDRNNEHLKIIEQQTSKECQDGQHCESVDRQELSPNKPNDDNQSVTTTRIKSPKERKEDQPLFLVKPPNVRQRLKAPEPQPVVVGLTDWYAEVESSAQSQVSPSSVNSDSTKRIQNGFHSNSSNPPSPNEIRRSNQMNHSFRSIRSDYSTRSMDRVGNPRYDKGYENKRHYNRGHYNNYNNNFQNNRNNYQQGNGQGHGNNGQYQDHHQNQNRYQHRRQNSDKGQNYQNKKNDNRGGGGGGNRGGGYNANNYQQNQQNRSYPSKSYGNRNRRQSYQHDDRSITPKPFEGGENWDEN